MERHDDHLLRELKALRKGRGVGAARIADQVGPRLRALCLITDSDAAGAIRQKLAARLDRLATGLPEDLALAARAALGLHPQAQQPFLADRVQWLAEQLQRDVRTARRRVDLGLAAMAERADVPEVAPPAPRVSDPSDSRQRGDDGNGWHIREFRALLRLDQATPEAHEQRTIVSNTDGLTELEAIITIPRDGTTRTSSHDLLVEVLYGVTIVSRERVTPNRFRYRLRLPHTLDAGESHEYGLLFRLPPNQPMRTHYVYTTLIRCDVFDLRIRFHPEQAPAEVWRVRETYPRDLDEIPDQRQAVELAGGAEAHLRFADLKLGLGYGAQWSPPPSTELRHGTG